MMRAGSRQNTLKKITLSNIIEVFFSTEYTSKSHCSRDIISKCYKHLEFYVLIHYVVTMLSRLYVYTVALKLIYNIQIML